VSDLESPLVESARSYALVTLACVGAVVGGGRLGLEGYAQLAVAAVLFYAASRGAERMPGGTARAGIALGGLFEPPEDPANAGFLGLRDLGRTLARGALPTLRELIVALLLAAIVFPPFFVGYVHWFELEGVVEWRAPLELAGLALTQIVLVAVPEEIYFRGYLQTRLSDVWPARRYFGVDVPVAAVIVQALLFGLLHFVVDPNPARLAVAGPGIVFGLLRSWRSGIGAAVFFHALCNLYSETLALSVR
jgi:membrane protease YdiL (CAAX protease family)